MTPCSPFAQRDPTWQRTVLLASDNSQSIIAEIADGKTNALAYSIYGEQSAQRKIVTRLGFNGQLREPKIGWYLLGHGYRAYNPRLMRFHSPDSWSPFGRGGLNAYMYCVGDPVNRVDPTGHSWLRLFAGLLDDAGVVMPWTRPIDHVPFLQRTGKSFNALNLPNVSDAALNITIGMRPERSAELTGILSAGVPVFAQKPKVRWIGKDSGGDRHSTAQWGNDRHLASGTRGRSTPNGFTPAIGATRTTKPPHGMDLGPEETWTLTVHSSKGVILALHVAPALHRGCAGVKESTDEDSRASHDGGTHPSHTTRRLQATLSVGAGLRIGQPPINARATPRPGP